MAARSLYSPDGWGFSAGVSGKPRLRTEAGRAGSDLSGFGDNFYGSWGDLVSDNALARTKALAPVSGGLGTGAPANTGNPFTTLRNVKNPGIDSAVQSVIGQVSSITGQPKDTVVSSTRSQNMADRLSSEFHNFDTDREGNRSTLADFTSNFIAEDPRAKQFADEEIGSVSEFYNGGVRSELDRMAGAQRIATAGALTPAIQAVLRNGNVGLLNGANDSYVGAQVAGQAGDLSRRAAVDNATNLRNNYLYELDGQNRNLGTRANLLDNYLKRSLVPSQVGQQMNETDLRRLYGIGAAESANTNYRVTNPQTEAAIKLGLLGDASRIDLGNTFYGVQKPYESKTQGFVPNRGYRPKVGGPPEDDPYGSPYGNPNGNPNGQPDIGNPNGQPDIGNQKGGNGNDLRKPIDPSWEPTSYDQVVAQNTGFRPPHQSAPLRPEERYDGSWGTDYLYDKVGPDGLTDAQRYYN